MNEPRTTFGKQCLEYGITSIPGDMLKTIIERNPDFSEHVVRVAKGKTARRFDVDEGSFYAVVDNATNVCMCLCTQATIRRLKRVRKRHKKTRSRVAGKNLRATKPWRD